MKLSGSTPPIPREILQSTSTENLALPDGTIVRPGEVVLWSPWVSARLSSAWGENAESFRPERWMEMNHKPSAYESPVFHGGPRSCLGQKMAKLELVVVMKELLERYVFEAGWDGGERRTGRAFTNPMEGGLPVRVRRR